MNGLLKILLALCLLLCLSAKAANPEVVVIGMATVDNSVPLARQQALNDALRKAVEQVIGTYLSTSSTLKSRENITNGAIDETLQFQERILKRADGYARVLQVVREGVNGTTYTIEVRAEVSQLPLEKELRTFLIRKGDPRIAVLLPEEILRRAVPDPAAETEISKHLISQGYRVVDPAHTEKVQVRDLLRNSLTSNSIRTIQARLNADLLVTGEAFAEEVENPPLEVTRAGMKAYNARVEIKVIDLSTGQVVFTDAAHAGAVGSSAAIAGKSALAEAARKLNSQVPTAILKWMAGAGSSAGRTYHLRIFNAGGFKQFSEFLAILRNSAGVQSVSPRNFDQAGATAEVEFDGSPEDLAILLEDLGATVQTLSGGDISIQMN